MKKSFFLIIAAFYSIFALSAQNSSLLISKDDIRIEGGSGKFKDSDGYHLFIRKRPGVESVMLTETTKDPAGNMDNYAYRALEYNSVNGDEIRYLNGKRLSSEMAKFSLIDSTAEKDEQFGQAFHIFIPSTIAYGYEWSRHGTIKIDKGTFINIRAFSKKYGDYTGNFYDNPFMFDLGAPVKKPVPAPTPIPEPAPLPDAIEEPVVLTDDYNPVAANAFSDIAEFNGGTLCYSRGPDTLVDDIMDSLARISPKQKVDVIFAIDTTGSMKDDVQKLREDWIPRLIASLKDYGNLRIGLLLYRDYGDTYRLMGLPVKRFEFTDKIEVFTKNLNNFVIYGNEGGDIPEAVYEALYASLAFYKWRIDATRKIILIGDAEPHPSPRGTGKYTKELVAQTAKAKGVVIDAIIVPDDKSARGR
ncbi:MAG: VWA domain-containing protein [Treponema sp.]|nr:VWA domain-containing protein [Treponema sp.]